MAKLIRVDGSESEHLDFSLEGYQKAVADGGLIQTFKFYDESGRVLIFDEEGKLKGKPKNIPATLLVSEWLSVGDYIAGDAIVAQIPEEFN